MAEKIPETYSDGVSNIHWCGNMVKIDFVSYDPKESGKPPVPEVTRRIVIPPQGLLALADSINALIEKLVAAGIFQKPEQKK